MKTVIHTTILSLTLIYLLQAAFWGKRLTYGLLVAFVLLSLTKFFRTKNG